jgi:hypothetical protein
MMSRPLATLFLFLAALLSLLGMSCSDGQEAQEVVSLEPDLVIDGSADLEHTFTPIDLAVDSQGKVFVLDNICMKILVFGPDGEFLYEFGGQGEAPGEFGRLDLNFDLDEAGFVYAINYPNTIEIFSNDGDYYGRIDSHLGQVFDIAASSPDRVYVNGFPWGAALLNSSSIPAVTLLDGDGAVVREFGRIETDLEAIREKQALFTCVIDVDQDNSVYCTSTADYEVCKYDSTGTLLWAVRGPSPYEVGFEQFENGTGIIPVVWDLDVDGNRVYVLWAQGGDVRGNRVDVFGADDGELEGYFYTQVPSEKWNWSIEVSRDFFYTVDYDGAKIHKFSMIND